MDAEPTRVQLDSKNFMSLHTFLYTFSNPVNYTQKHEQPTSDPECFSSLYLEINLYNQRLDMISARKVASILNQQWS